MIRVDSTEVRLFADRLQDVAPTARKALRKKITEAGRDVTSAIKASASWSSRIPAATTMRVGFGKRGGVRIGVNAGEAPHARPHNFPNRGTMIRHPVYGQRDQPWVETPGHPDWFFKPVRAKEAAVVAKVSEAIDEAIKGL